MIKMCFLQNIASFEILIPIIKLFYKWYNMQKLVDYVSNIFAVSIIMWRQLYSIRTGDSRWDASHHF